mmetsp:Transcript_37595/g.93475  ORF Transcript_37595/g.93475 Transcript_37595/m.93475 type:complete len:279 (-) Transcript_37595:132-968(-)
MMAMMAAGCSASTVAHGAARPGLHQRQVSTPPSLSKSLHRRASRASATVVARAADGADGPPASAPPPAAAVSAPPPTFDAGAPAPALKNVDAKKLAKKAAKAAKAPPPLQKPKRRKAPSGEKAIEVPPTEAETAASDKYDAMLAEGGIVYEVFIRAKGPNQWFPVGPMAVKQDWMIVPEMWKAVEPMKKAGFKMYPALARAPCFGKVEYGYRQRDDSNKMTEEQIRAGEGKLNPFEDVQLLEVPADGVGGPPELTLMDKFNKFMNPYGSGGDKDASAK